MLLVPCPHCGPRNSADMSYQGEASSRPDPSSATPAQWRDYLYMEHNPAGWLKENWYCSSGCRRFFTVERHTVTSEFREPPLPGSKTALPLSKTTEATAGSDQQEAES